MKCTQWRRRKREEKRKKMRCEEGQIKGKEGGGLERIREKMKGTENR